MLLRTGMREEVRQQVEPQHVVQAQCARSVPVCSRDSYHPNPKKLPYFSPSFFDPHLPPQGLFRLAAAASVVKRLKTCLDQGAVDHSEFSMDPHAVAGNHPGGDVQPACQPDSS